ncbi:MAG TPA: hypothetical protein VEF71_21295 [Streptosporangiaceae bacterium]|nr:hypothetical protein [Streptosporangiaceae bacterium]
MTAMTHEPSTAMPARRDIASQLLVREFWAALSIIAMWLAVLFDGVFGGDMVFSSVDHMTTIPSAVLVALFAVFGTMAVAHRGFRRPGEN